MNLTYIKLKIYTRLNRFAAKVHTFAEKVISRTDYAICDIFFQLGDDDPKSPTKWYFFPEDHEFPFDYDGGFDADYDIDWDNLPF